LRKKQAVEREREEERRLAIEVSRLLYSAMWRRVVW
jgi:hypothetical protein